MIAACENKISSGFKFLYPLTLGLKDKIEKIAVEIYGAAGVSFSEEAAKRLDKYEEQGYGGLPICMAKTHLSFTDDPNVKGAPKGFILPIKGVSASIGAGFIVALVGEVSE